MSKETKEDKNEQIRAIFVLGLLAVLASIRTQNASIIAPIGTQSFDILPIIDSMIVLMSFYSLFMIFGYSKDMIGEIFADIFKEIAKAFLIMNFMLLLVVAFALAIAYYQNRLLWFFGLIAIPIAYLTYQKLKKFKDQLKRTLRTKKKITDFIPLFSGLGLIFSLLQLGYYSNEEYIPIYFVTGVLCMIVVIYFSSKNKNKTRQTHI